MRSWAYSKVVHIQEKVETQDPVNGDISHSWETFHLDGNSDKPMNQCPAEVLTGPGREPIIADAKQAETTARINLPWFPGLLPTMRILWDGRVYNITSIAVDRTARDQYRLTCSDGLTDGQ